jgi:hypothetical protein
VCALRERDQAKQATHTRPSISVGLSRKQSFGNMGSQAGKQPKQENKQTENFRNMILHRRKQAYTGKQRPTPDDKGSGSHQSLAISNTASRH